MPAGLCATSRARRPRLLELVATGAWPIADTHFDPDPARSIRGSRNR